MRYPACALVLSAILVLTQRALAADKKPSGPGGNQARWQTLEVPDAKCAVEFPGKPAKQVKDLDSAAGKLSLTMYVLETNGGKAAYLFTFNDYPAGFGKASPLQGLLDGGRDGCVKAVGGKLGEEKEIKVNGNPGRYFTYSGGQAGQEFKAQAKIWFVGDRLYQLQTIGFGSALDPADADKFLASVRPLKRTKPAKAPVAPAPARRAE